MNNSLEKKDAAALQPTYTAGTDVEIVEEANAATDKVLRSIYAAGIDVEIVEEGDTDTDKVTRTTI